MGADLSAPMKPIELGQLDIDQNQIRANGRKFLQDVAKIPNAMYPIGPLLQTFTNFLKQGRIVFD
ncbi:hypothetical protein D3C73_1538820 [compost metagenome]